MLLASIYYTEIFEKGSGFGENLLNTILCKTQRVR